MHDPAATLDTARRVLTSQAAPLERVARLERLRQGGRAAQLRPLLDQALAGPRNRPSPGTARTPPRPAPPRS